MPEDGINMLSHKDILSYDEITEVVKTAVDLGIDKVRITGGEPLVRKNIEILIKQIADIDGIKDLGLTTNGILLPQYAEKLKQAGLKRVNISLDTVDPERFAQITRGGDIKQIFEGIKAAQKAGLNPVKINSVVFNKNDQETRNQLKKFAADNNLELRFIQQMNLDSGEFSVVEGGSGGDCSLCNRLRLTANGYIKPCLFDESGWNIREVGIKQAILEAVNHKPKEGSICHNHKFYNIGG